MDIVHQAVEKITSSFPQEVLAVSEHAKQVAVCIKPGRVLELLRLLRDDPELRFDYLQDICGLDYSGADLETRLGAAWESAPGRDAVAEARFAVVYSLYSFPNNLHMRLKAFLPEEKPEIDSASPLWPAADWAEREAYDMYGIIFNGHPNLVRILNPDTYVYYPLRKEYPMRGMGERDNFPVIRRGE